MKKYTLGNNLGITIKFKIQLFYIFMSMHRQYQSVEKLEKYAFFSVA